MINLLGREITAKNHLSYSLKEFVVCEIIYDALYDVTID